MQSKNDLLFFDGYMTTFKIRAKIIQPPEPAALTTPLKTCIKNKFSISLVYDIKQKSVLFIHIKHIYLMPLLWNPTSFPPLG